MPRSTTLTTHPYIYAFGPQLPPPPLDKNLLGGKGEGLAEMASLGLPIPPGFILTTEACNAYRREERHLPKELEREIEQALQQLEKQTGKKFGNSASPLLVSVRSGARVSMPGMMDTVLNLGLNDVVVERFAADNPRLAYDSYRRLIMMYADIVAGVKRHHFDQSFEALKKAEKVTRDTDLSPVALKRCCQEFQQLYKQQTGKPFPQDPHQQLLAAIQAVFNSWDSERATLYRQLHHYPDDWGTAVTVQTMVFGNKNDCSATGVGFSRDPASGLNHFYGEFLLNAQGEEVVAGIRTPHPINKYQKQVMGSELDSLEELMPEVYQQLHGIVKKLEKHFNDMQDIEFTIDDGQLFMLQTRTGKRTGFAAIKMAVEMLDEGLIDEKTALRRIQPDQLSQLLAPVFDAKAKAAAHDQLAAYGLNAGPGAASGRIAFSKEQAILYKQQGMATVLVRQETNPDDFPGMVAADGILTLRGGSTSHAAVVARGMGKPCVVGCGALQIHSTTKTLHAPQHPQKLSIKEGDFISIDGLTGEVFFCKLESSPSEILQVLLTHTKRPEESVIYQQYKRVMDLADKYRRLRVFANADTPADSAIARAFGAEGIGLCRTEHMFLEVDRLNDVRRMFFSLHPQERQQAINRLLPYQKQDFIGIFRAMEGYPVTIRFLDPPLHEFMPHTDSELKTLADLMHIPQEQLAHIASSLEEHNPMLGHRGCRLGITYPEVTAMQTRAILEAAIEVEQEGMKVHPELMVPLVATEAELIHQKAVIDQTAAAVFKEKGTSIAYAVGTMIELPRAALTADRIAREAEFFSFGTNDLTQTTLGISRDDSTKFVPLYVNGVPDPRHAGDLIHIYSQDPFQVIDREGVGQLMQIALERGRRTRPHLICGICGEHGGDAESIQFCDELQLDYVSCSPYRVPVARLAAAVASLTPRSDAKK